MTAEPRLLHRIRFEDGDNNEWKGIHINTHKIEIYRPSHHIEIVVIVISRLTNHFAVVQQGHNYYKQTEKTTAKCNKIKIIPYSSIKLPKTKIYVFRAVF